MTKTLRLTPGNPKKFYPPPPPPPNFCARGRGVMSARKIGTGDASRPCQPRALESSHRRGPSAAGARWFAGLALVRARRLLLPATAAFAQDTTPPTVTSVGFYSDQAATTPITSAGAQAVYFKVTFSENVQHTDSPNSRTNGRPAIAVSIDTTGNDSIERGMYMLPASTGNLSTSQCKPTTATPASVYICRYNVTSSLLFLSAAVNTGTQDTAGNALASKYESFTIRGLNGADFSLSKTSLTLAEAGASDTFTVSMTSAPEPGQEGSDADNAFVAVKLTSSDTSALTVSPATLKIPRSNTPQTVTVTAVADSVAGNRTPSVSVSVDPSVSGTSTLYNRMRGAAVAVTVTDDDAAMTVDTDPDTSGIQTDPLSVVKGSTGRFTVVLDAKPTGNVSVALSSDNTDVTLSDSSLTFTTGNYNAAKTVTVTAASSPSDTDASVTVNPSGGGYDGVTTATVAVRLIDPADGTPPTVTAASSGYYGTYSNGTVSNALTGPVKASTDIYTKITFSEDVTHVASDLAAARPHISYGIAGTATQYHIVANSATLATGDCKPNHATNTNVYICLYTTADGNNGDFDFRVGTETTDKASNALATAYTHTTKLAIDTTAPTVTAASSGYYDSADADTALTGPVKASTDIYTKITFSENVNHVAGSGANLSSARPHLSYAIGGTATQYDIVASTVTLATGDCKPNHATNTNVYICRYTTAAGNNGDFDFRVGIATADKANNPLAAAYTHTTKLAIDNTAPTVTFSPANGARTSAKAGNITLTFSEAVYSDSAGTTAFTADTLGGANGLIKLKVTDDDGATIPFAASINDANTVVTVNPSSDLSDGDVYVEMGSGFYDAGGNQGTQATATFTVNTTAAAVTFSPANGMSTRDKAGDITLTFSEAVYKDTNGTEFETGDLGALIELKVNNDKGTPISFAASINDTNTVVTVEPVFGPGRRRRVRGGGRRLLRRRRQPGGAGHGDVHGGHRGSVGDVQPGGRGEHQRQVGEHHADVQRSSVQGRERHGVRGQRPEDTDRAEGDRRQWRGHRLYCQHQCGQHGGHGEPVFGPVRRRRVRGGGQRFLRRHRQSGFGDQRDVHGGHRSANRVGLQSRRRRHHRRVARQHHRGL